MTRNLTPGESVYGEKRVAIEAPAETRPDNDDTATNGDAAPAPPTKTEYRVWNPFRSKLAAAIIGGLDDIYMRPGGKVLYLGAASGTSVSHVADLVGSSGTVYAVEFSHRSGRDLINMATRRTNVIPIIEDARHPLRYRMLVGMVDVVFADVAQPDQARIVALNAHLYLKVGGAVLISIKANCIDSTAPPEAVFASEVQKLRSERLKPLEQLTLEPFERGRWRPSEPMAAADSVLRPLYAGSKVPAIIVTWPFEKASACGWLYGAFARRRQKALVLQRRGPMNISKCCAEAW